MSLQPEAPSLFPQTPPGVLDLNNLFYIGHSGNFLDVLQTLFQSPMLRTVFPNIDEAAISFYKGLADKKFSANLFTKVKFKGVSQNVFGESQDVPGAGILRDAIRSRG